MDEPAAGWSRTADLLAKLTLATLLALLAVAEGFGAEGHAEVAGPWQAPLRAADRAIAAGDARAASRALREAWAAARGSRQWEAMVAVGDTAGRAHRSLGDARALGLARLAYRTALFWARTAGALEGVVAACEGFAALGDRAVVAQCRVEVEAPRYAGRTEPRRSRAAPEPPAGAGARRLGPAGWP